MSRLALAAPCALAMAVATAVACPVPAQAELVVLTTGEVMKVARFEASGETAELVLPQGGSLTMSILRIERVVADEIEPAPAGAEAAPPAAEPEAGRWVVDYAPEHPIPDVPYGGLIYWASRRHRVNPSVVAAVARAESAFDAGVVSSKGAVGLLQIMPATGQRFGLRRAELFDPKKNLDAGTRYLRWLLDRFGGELPLALAAYNAGEGAVDRYGGIPPYRETQGYVRRILAALEGEAVLASLPGGAPPAAQASPSSR